MTTAQRNANVNKCCFTLLGYNAVSSSNFLPTFWDNISVVLNPEDGTNRLSQNASKKLPLLTT